MAHTRIWTSVATVVAATAASAAIASGTYFNLGSGNTPSGVSANGTFVAGDVGFSTFFTWTPGGGLVNIGGTITAGQAKVSDDGGRVCGMVLDAASGAREMALYEVALGTWTALGGIGAPCSGETSSGWGISGDGQSVVGLGWIGCGGAHAIQWDEGGATFDLGSTVVNRSSRANGVNLDGTVVVGWQDSSVGFRQGAIWVNGVQSIITTVAGGTGAVLGEAADVSADGTWAVGNGVSSNSFQAWRWSSATGATNIGPPPTAGWRGASVAISADGDTVVGYYRPFPGPATFGQGFIWTAAGGMQNLNTYCTSKGVAIPAGVVLALPLDVSPDGNTIVGVARNANSTFGFVVTIDPPCPADLNGDGQVDAADLALVLGAWGGRGSADLDGSGTVDGGDLAIVLGAWGPC